ncbi:hypothetical protein [Sphingopyxis indica]|uniref:Uncharacterized protein n=1 Tax=Sphingopyxis indica TaxID=436663 RepID=A0A239KME8_9SPHN|nr:hypothetical protein [Sphingopyxis indica]SNT19235.1 hypothetical protein SAMN06295955_11542 [Sphingopyxis indica]
MNIAIQFVLALASGAMALVTWHESMPKVITLRGRWNGFCEWVLGLALALLSPALLDNAMRGVEAGWHFIGADIAIVAYAFCRFRWLRSQSSGSWKCSA